MNEQKRNNLHMALQAAELAKLGAVFPIWSVKDGRCRCPQGTGCPGAGKHPIGSMVPHGLIDASRELSQITQWFVRAPWANIGLVANDDFWILDVDPGHGGEESITKIEVITGPLPKTVVAITGSGGRHIFFKPPAGKRVRNTTNVLGEEFPGLDTRAGNRGYIVAVGSIHRSGRRYEWAPGCAPGEVEVAEAPGWLIERVVEKPRERRSAPMPASITDLERRRAQGLLEWAANEAASAAQGERNNTLFKMAAMVGGWVGAGYLTRHDAEAALEDAGQACGLSRREAEQTTCNGLDRGESDPHGLPDDSERKLAWMIERGLFVEPLPLDEVGAGKGVL